MSNDELMCIEGGLAKISFYGILVSTLTFLIGLFDGMIRPGKCNV